MYTEFYGLSAFPFQLTPDPRFFFESSIHRRAVAHLLFGLDQGEGFIVVTGDIGAGKTTVLGHLLENLDPALVVAAKLVSTGLDADDLLRSVAAAFGLAFEGRDKAALLRAIEAFLLANHGRGLRTLLLIDEAQNLTPAALEELRMLSNFQVGAKAPLQSFLLGQPEFRQRLAAPGLEQLRQRIIASYHLGSLSREESRDYVLHRLGVAGWRNDPEISEEAFDRLFAQAGGVPRRINLLCSRLLLFGFLEGRHRLDGEAVALVADDLRREGIQAEETVGLAPADGEGGLAGRLTRLEQTVARHGKALEFLAPVAERLMPRLTDCG